MTNIVLKWMEKGNQTNFSLWLRLVSFEFSSPKPRWKRLVPLILSPGTSAYQSTASQPKTLVHIPICWYHAPKRLCSKFSVESFSLLQFSISLENLSRFLNQSDVELNPTVSWPLTFSRSWARLLVFILRFHWFLLKFSRLSIAHCSRLWVGVCDTSSKSALLGHLNLFFYCMRDFKFIIESCALKITKWKHRFDFLVANSSFAQFSKIQTKLRPSRYVHVRCILAQKSSN